MFNLIHEINLFIYIIIIRSNLKLSVENHKKKEFIPDTDNSEVQSYVSYIYKLKKYTVRIL